MKICKRCFREFEEDENLYDSPAAELIEIFFDSARNENLNELCSQCREELGMLNLIGFKQ